MRKFMVLLGIMIIGFAGVYFYLTHGESDESKALRRVETMLRGITSTDDGRTVEGDEESAIGMFWYGKHRIPDQDLFEEATDQFDRWRGKANIFPYITSFTVDSAEKRGKLLVVFGTIEDAPFKIRVPENGPLAWHEMPDLE